MSARQMKKALEDDLKNLDDDSSEEEITNFQSFQPKNAFFVRNNQEI